MTRQETFHGLFGSLLSKKQSYTENRRFGFHSRLSGSQVIFRLRQPCADLSFFLRVKRHTRAFLHAIL